MQCVGFWSIQNIHFGYISQITEIPIVKFHSSIWCFCFALDLTKNGEKTSDFQPQFFVYLFIWIWFNCNTLIMQENSTSIPTFTKPNAVNVFSHRIDTTHAKVYGNMIAVRSILSGTNKFGRLKDEIGGWNWKILHQKMQNCRQID